MFRVNGNTSKRKFWASYGLTFEYLLSEAVWWEMFTEA